MNIRVISMMSFESGVNTCEDNLLQSCLVDVSGLTSFDYTAKDEH